MKNMEKVKIQINLILASEEYQTFLRHIWPFILFLSLWFTAVIFFQISRDFETYNVWCISACESMEAAVEKDPLFGISCLFFSVLKPDPTVLVALVWIFASLLLKFTAFRMETKTFIWSLFTYITFFYITHEMTQIRAAFASAALGYAFVQVVNKNYLKSVLFSLIAVAAHLSSLLVLPILLVLPMLIKTKRRFIITVMLCQAVFVLAAFSKDIQNIFISIISNLLGIDARIEMYLYFYDMDDVTALGKNVRVLFFMIISLLVLAKVLVSDEYDDTKLLYGSTGMTMIAVLILSLSYAVPSISLRFFELFAVAMSLMVGSYMQSIENRYFADIIGYIFIVAYVGLFFNSFKILT